MPRSLEDVERSLSPRPSVTGQTTGPDFAGDELVSPPTGSLMPSQPLPGGLTLEAPGGVRITRHFPRRRSDIAPPRVESQPVQPPQPPAVERLQDGPQPLEADLAGRTPSTIRVPGGLVTAYQAVGDQPGAVRFTDGQTGLVGTSRWQPGESMAAALQRAERDAQTLAGVEAAQQMPPQQPDPQRFGTMEADAGQPVREAIGSAVRGALQYAPIIGGQPALQQAADQVQTRVPASVSVAEQARNAGNSGARTIATTLAAIPRATGKLDQIIAKWTGISALENATGIPLLEAKGRFIENLGTELQRWAEDRHPGDPRLQNDLITTLAPEVTGQLLTYFGLSAVSGGVGGAGLRMMTAGMAGAANQGISEYDRAIAEGQSQSEADRRFLLNLPVGATEALPVDRMLTRMIAGDDIGRAMLRSVIENAAQGGGATAGGNVIAGRPVGEGVAQAAALEGLAGGAVQGVGSLAARLPMPRAATGEGPAAVVEPEPMPAEAAQPQPAEAVQQPQAVQPTIEPARPDAAPEPATTPAATPQQQPQATPQQINPVEAADRLSRDYEQAAVQEGTLDMAQVMQSFAQRQQRQAQARQAAQDRQQIERGRAIDRQLARLYRFADQAGASGDPAFAERHRDILQALSEAIDSGNPNKVKQAAAPVVRAVRNWKRLGSAGQPQPTPPASPTLADELRPQAPRRQRPQPQAPRRPAMSMQPDRVRDDGRTAIFYGKGSRAKAEAYAADLRQTVSSDGATVRVDDLSTGLGSVVRVIESAKPVSAAPPPLGLPSDAATAPQPTTDTTPTNAVPEPRQSASMRAAEPVAEADRVGAPSVETERPASEAVADRPAVPDRSALLRLDARELLDLARDAGVPRERLSSRKRDLIDALDQHRAALDDVATLPTSDGLELELHAGVGRLATMLHLDRTAGGAISIARKLADWWSAPLLDVVERQGGEAGRTLAGLARKANDRARQIMGQLNADLVALQNLASGKTSGSRRAVADLSRIEWDQSGRYGFTVLQSAVEGRTDLDGLSPEARRVVELYRELVRRTGSMAEDAGVLVTDRPAKGQEADEPRYVPFKASDDGALLIRRATPELWDVMHRGSDSAAFQALARSLAEVNGLADDVALQQLKAMAERAITRRAPFEVSRHFPRFPTHLAVGERVIPLLHSEPYSAAHALVRSTAMRLGYIEAVGQDLPGRSLSEELIDRFEAEGGERQDAEDLVRALNGVPIDRPITKPGTPEHEVERWGRFALSLVRTGLLTRSAVVNVPETLAKIPAFAGLRRYLKAWQYLALHPRSAAVETARLGARSQEVMRLTVEPERARESVSRIVRDLGLRIVGAIPMNELNELHAAVAGLIFARDLKAGRVSMFDRPRLELLGFDDGQIDRMLSGRPPARLLDTLVRRMAERTQGSTSLPSERSRAASSRRYGAAVSFDSYAQMTFDRTMLVNRKLIEAMKSGDSQRIAKASTVAAQYYFGSGVSGSVAWLLRALVVGGPAGLLIAMHEAKEEPERFALESLRYTLLGGPAEAVLRSAAGDGDTWYEPLVRVVLPASLLTEVLGFASGSGSYRDRSWLERSERFLQRHVTASGAVSTWAAVIGLGEKDAELDQAIAAYWRWRFRNYPPGSFTPGREKTAEEAAQHHEFRMHMRRAVETMRGGGDPIDELTAALQVDGKGMSSVAASLRARKILGGSSRLSDEQLAELRQAIPAWAYAKLEAHDAVIDSWLQAMKDRSRSSKSRQ